MQLRDVIIGLVVVGVVALLQAAYSGISFLIDRRKAKLQRRLLSVGESDEDAVAQASLLRKDRFGGSGDGEGLLAQMSITKNLGKLLDQTELELTVQQLLLICGITAFLGLAGGVFMNFGMATIGLIAVMGFLPVLYVKWTAGRRRDKITEQLPDALEMMTRALRAGYALPASFKLVAQEMPAPIATEFGRCYEDQRLGLPFEQAVASMTERAPQNLELRIMAVCMIIQAQTGGNLIEVLEKIAETIRERFKFFGRLKALTAEGKMAAMILGSLPFLVFMALYVLNREYILELVNDEKGIYIMGMGLFQWSLGLFWMSRIVKVEF
jgi:tight adherence protein B